MSTRVIKAFAILSLALSSKTYAGGSSTHGANESLAHNNPWFLGEDDIPYCVLSDSQEMQSSYEALVERAIRDWQDFFQKYKLDRQTFKNIISLHADISEHRGMLSPLPINLNFKRTTGPCANIKTGVVFTFMFQRDMMDNPVTKELDLDLAGKLAASVRYQEPIENLAHFNTETRNMLRDYNHETFHNGGLVWVSPRGLGQETKHLLLHEIGHVLGMEENSVFVMSRLIADRIKAGIYDPWFGQIESDQWKYIFQEKDSINFTKSWSCSYGDGLVDGYASYQGHPVLNLFGFDVRDYCLAISLSYERVEEGERIYRLDIQSLGGKQLSLRAHMGKTNVDRIRSPALFTKIYRVGWIHRSLLQADDGYNADGYLDYEGKTLPASFSFVKDSANDQGYLGNQQIGPVLKLFSPDTREWVNIAMPSMPN